jgi:hypothetical protein
MTTEPFDLLPEFENSSMTMWDDADDEPVPFEEEAR